MIFFALPLMFATATPMNAETEAKRVRLSRLTLLLLDVRKEIEDECNR